jgi:hypothetical protein
VPVILFLAAAAILGCVVLVAMGMAGEMAAFPSDCAVLRLDDVTATDVALLRPPLALWGYNVPATEEALGVIARAVTARDTEIATLRQELADIRARQIAEERWPHEHRPEPGQPQEQPGGSWSGAEAPEAWPRGVPSGPAAPDLPAWPMPPDPGPSD